MGRLFWKIFAGFWITLLLTVIGVSAALMIREEARRSEESAIATGPRSTYALRMAWTVASFGGGEALAKYVAQWPVREGEPPLVVDAGGNDRFGRAVPAEALEQARAALAAETGNDRRRKARRWKDDAGKEWLMFFPQGSTREPPRASPVPEFRLEGPILAALAALLASVLVSALLARNFSRPIHRLQGAFQAASDGQLNVRVAQGMAGRRDELGQLGREFDGMVQKLQQLVGSQNRLMHDVSHELRSPLARLQVAVGLARQNPAQVETALSRIEREAERLDELVGEVLTLARLEGLMRQPAEDYVDLIELLDSVVEDARFEAEGSGRKVMFSTSHEGELVIRARGELLHRAFDNVVRNALRHTPVDSLVEVSLVHQARADSMHITVADAGPGVPENELESIFDPFHRGESAGGAGYGLGLAIARRAIEAHGGRMWAQNRQQGSGLEVHFRLPLEQTSLKTV
ncbi:ATP-binding protein [Uliginosibacterium paludis]|uniref:histidine kinase n=1 Tax=Uliginosibacterium paludis TaxID=1615952 RepID=A0ABV2CPD5_9RHOO